MRVVVTGAYSNVGQSTLRALLDQGDEVIAFDIATKKTKSMAARLAQEHPGRFSPVFGDIRDKAAVQKLILNVPHGVDAICHLAAIIPPAADRDPALAATVNIGGTQAILDAMAACPRMPVLVFASSVATYGDRVESPYIRVEDPLKPCDDDEYAKQKVICEGLIRASDVPWTILRLSYIVWRKQLAMDRLMFRMPLTTSLEVCHTSDAGLAFAHATRRFEAIGRTLNLGGGERCRTTFHIYLNRMFLLFGLGGAQFLPKAAFSPKGYHCGFLDTAEAQRILDFQRTSLEDYYAEVAEEARATRFWARIFRPIARAWVLSRSPYLQNP